MSFRTLVVPFVGTSFLLGLGIPLSRAAATEGVDAAAFAFWPTLVAGVVLALVAWLRRGTPALDARLLRFGLVSGVVGHAVPVSASLWLAANAASTLVAVTFVLPPLFTLVIAMLVGQQRPTWRRAAGLGIGLAAATTVVAAGDGLTLVGACEAALALLIPTTIGSANVYRAIHLPRRVPAEWLGAKMLLCSAAAMAAIGATVGGLALPVEMPALGWTGLQTLALVGGYLLYFVLQRHAGPVTFSFIGYGMTATGIAGAALLLGERPQLGALLALGVVAGALWWMQAGGAHSAPAGRSNASGPVPATTEGHRAAQAVASMGCGESSCGSGTQQRAPARARAAPDRDSAA